MKRFVPKQNTKFTLRQHSTPTQYPGHDTRSQELCQLLSSLLCLHLQDILSGILVLVEVLYLGEWNLVLLLAGQHSIWDRIVLTKYKLLQGVLRPNYNLHVLQVTGSVTSVPGSVLLRNPG